MITSKKINLFNFSPLILIIWGIISILFFERIPIFNGFGWDGRLYGSLAMDFEKIISNRLLEAYSSQRIVPSFLIFYSLKLFNITHSIENVISAFSIYALTVITLCGILWVRISSELKLSVGSKWLGFILLFLNYPFLKYFFYYPVSTDYTAFLLGMIMLYAGLKSSNFLLLISICLSYFSWPAGIVPGILLFLFPILKVEKNEEGRASIFFRKFFTFLFMIIFSAILFYAVIITKFKYEKSLLWYFNLFISASLILCFAIFVIAPFVRHFPYSGFFKQLVSKRSILKISLIVVLLLCLSFCKSFLYNSQTTSNFGITQLFVNIFIYAVELPFKFIVSHIVFWGPSIILIIIFSNEIFDKIFKYGYGMILIVVYILIFSLDSESRILLNVYPFIVLFIVEVFDPLLIRNKKYFYSFLILISILLSKVWLPVNMPSTWIAGQVDFPFQRYFMQHGPWMSISMFILQSAIILIMAIILLMFFPKKIERMKIWLRNITGTLK